MSNHLITVIIPVYNTAEYLPRCLDSILNNTYKHLEILCINDGSPDNSLEVLNAYAAQDSRIRVIDQENAGVSAARNRGLDEATGEYIAFVDSDDWIHRQYFEVLLTNALAHQAHITVCSHTMLSETVSDPVLSAEQTNAVSMTYARMASKDIPSWGRLYRRACVNSIRFDKGITLAEDTVFNLELLHSNPPLRLVHCDAPMYYYFSRENSLVHTLPNKKFAPLIRYYLSCTHSFDDRAVGRECLLRSFKTLFLWRYRATFQHDPDSDALLRELLNQACAILRKADGISFLNKLQWLSMAKFPILYRLFRIIMDPTMLGWEKQQRQKARAEKNHK